MVKRILALCLTFVMVLGMMPVVSFAEEPADYMAAHASNITVDRDNLVDAGWIYEGIAWYALLH